MEKHPNAEAVKQLYDDVLAIRETLGRFAKGDFDIPITGRGTVWGHLKALQANLKHLTWQVEQVAAGDLSQRVDFMGDFSVAFNKMVLQLESSLEEMKEQEASERIQIMLDATPLCCCFWKEQHELLDCNLEAVKLYGASSKKEFIDRFYELLPTYQPNGKLSAELIREKLQEAFENGYAQCECVSQTLGGEPIPAEVTFVRVQRHDHSIVASYLRDLRELKQKQAALEKQQLLLIDVINTSPICFAILVKDKIRFASLFMTDHLGVMVGESLIDYFVDQEKGIAVFSHVKESSHVNWEPITVRSKEGEVKDMLANLFLTDYYGEQGIIVWLVDITELKRIEADLRAAKDTAEHLGRVKDEFIANISHELRTPINAVFGILHLLHNTNLSEEQESYIGTMEASAKHLLQIINDILDFSHIESGKVFIGSENFDVRQTVSNVLTLLRESAEEKSLPLRCQVDKEVPTLITGDPLRLQQVLTSLADNAIKFTEQGSVEIRVQLESAEQNQIVLRFSVQDTGIGMSDEDQLKLFRPFSQADASRTRKYGGIGLGLTVAKNLVERMGGRIWYATEVQKGSTFFFTATFELPTIESEAESVIYAESSRGLPILLAEDNRINQIVATKLLQEKGFCVDVAPHGLRAVEMVKQKDYALVLMDIQMPEMDGFQATLTIRSDPKYASLPIVALTANAMEDDRQRCLAAGMNDHLAKPIDPAQLFQAILRWAKPMNEK